MLAKKGASHARSSERSCCVTRANSRCPRMAVQLWFRKWTNLKKENEGLLFASTSRGLIAWEDLELFFSCVLVDSGANAFMPLSRKNKTSCLIFFRVLLCCQNRSDLLRQNKPLKSQSVSGTNIFAAEPVNL